MKLQKKRRNGVAVIKILPERYTGFDSDFTALISDIINFTKADTQLDGLVLDFSQTGFLPMNTLSAIDSLVFAVKQQKLTIGIVGLPGEMAKSFSAYEVETVSQFETVRQAARIRAADGAGQVKKLRRSALAATVEVSK